MRAMFVLGFHLVAAVGLVSVAMEQRVAANGKEICDNGIDDTYEGLIDCADPACANDPACNFEEGCCILIDCENGSGVAAGRTDSAELTCLDSATQVECADHILAPPCAGDPESIDCLNGHLICDDANLVRVSCAHVPGCAQFAPEFGAPATSRTGLVGLALLLSASGLYHLQRRRPV